MRPAFNCDVWTVSGALCPTDDCPHITNWILSYFRGRAVKGGQARGDKETAKPEDGKTEEKPAGEGHGGGQRRGDGDHGKARGKKSGRTRPPTRERTSEMLRRQEIEVSYGGVREATSLLLSGVVGLVVIYTCT